MKFLTLSLIVSTILLTSCGSVPVTGRKQMLLVSNQEVLSLSLQQYDQFIKSAPISTDKKNTEMVKRAGQRIATAVETYLKNNGFADQATEFAWEFNLVKSNDVNAFCMPGGKIVVYEGILPITRDETGLAVVMGHEVAHAVAKHANERMSQQTATQMGTTALAEALSGESAKTQQIAGAVFGLGAQYGLLLPYSRLQESEADKLGLIFMAMAGYNPSEAANFWTRMSQSGGGKGPEFMSTHPSDETRIREIQKALPEALKYYGGGASAGAKTSSGSKTTTKGAAKTSNQWKF